jgi:hypothetical protein
MAVDQDKLNAFGGDGYDLVASFDCFHEPATARA